MIDNVMIVLIHYLLLKLRKSLPHRKGHLPSAAY